MSAKIIAILTSRRYLLDAHIDDELLKDRLMTLGYSVDIVNWDSQHYNFSKATLAIVRSCWDFHLRKDEYLHTLKQISKQTTLVNSYELIYRYFSKCYLLKMQQSGINTVPTFIASSTEELPEIISDIESEQIVLKPAISASGDNTYKLNKKDRKSIDYYATQILSKGKLVVQSYIQSIQYIGEYSMVMIEGDVTFTIHKSPEDGNFLIHEHHGGLYTPIKTLNSHKKFAEKVYKALYEKPTYMRIDCLIGDNGEPMLLELETNEPNLYLSRSKENLDRLAQALDSIISTKTKES